MINGSSMMSSGSWVGFKDGVDPDRNEKQQVLYYLGIKKWSECDKEIKFLDTEIGTEYLNEEKRRELSLLSSLMGLLSYCRCVMFDLVDTKANQQVNQWSTKMLNGVSPDDFRCPISLEIMKDPVTLCSGHTYDRASILKWFRAGNSTCPKTGERLKNKELVSNLALKRTIQDWSVENGVCIGEESNHKNRDITRTVLAGSMAAEGAVKLLANFLAGRLVDGTSEEKNKAAYEIRLLTKTNIFSRSCLVEVGCIPSLLNLLSSKDSSTQENAIAALLNLSKHQKSRSIIVGNGGLELIIDVLKKGLKVEARNHAAATLFYIASIEEYRKLIGEIPEAIPALVEMVRDGTNRGKKNALVAIFGLLMHPGNHWKVLAAGTVPLLVDLLSSSNRQEIVTNSLAVLATIAEKVEGTLAIIRHGALNVIVRILDDSTSRAGKEYCVSLLLALCINGGAYVVALLAKSPSLMGSLYSLLSEGTSRASKKASALIRVLHEFYERSSPGAMAPVLPQERSVHVW
ncbi:hypothetical protein Patl1_16172 [Pistacia atlantica]|uniref:Uncharacterized protein n=1 Tax=Pistacia atlantica TaxID=434234 RepID=A0ACC1B632_9ROSI|nr:hypothetical protein Patl1_16172 [Pistacia atlantica]